MWFEDAMHVSITPVQLKWRQVQWYIIRVVVFIQKSSDLIRQILQNCIFTKLASVAVQYRFPYECMVTQVVAATTGQTVDQKSPNPCAIPNVDSYSGKVSTGRIGLWFRGVLVPAVSSKRNTVSGAIVLIMPIVSIASILNSCWQYVKMSVNMYNMQNLHNNIINYKYVMNYKYEEYVNIQCIYPGCLHTA